MKTTTTKKKQVQQYSNTNTILHYIYFESKLWLILFSFIDFQVEKKCPFKNGMNYIYIMLKCQLDINVD